jgi:hypothetical protein
MTQKNSQMFKQGIAGRRKYGTSVIPQQLEIIKRLESGEN